MYCSGCGQLVPPGQQFCPHCGRPVAQVASGLAPTHAPYFYTRVHRHIQSLAILWIAYAAWTLLGWLLAMSIFHGMFAGYFGHWNHAPWSGPFNEIPWLLPMITVLLIGRAVLSLVTGLALLYRAPWARILAIVAAFLTIFKLFTGTALAIYTLWVLLPGPSGQEYDQMARPPI
jgi:hypothetical protein